tara:strand:- start:58 stop:279 length:222 start_codon:yes stop_codon:yes gene_type:complete
MPRHTLFITILTLKNEALTRGIDMSNDIERFDYNVEPRMSFKIKKSVNEVYSTLHNLSKIYTFDFKPNVRIKK